MLNCKKISGFYHRVVGDILRSQLAHTSRQDQPTVLWQSFNEIRSLAISDGESPTPHTIYFDLNSYLL